MYSVNDIYIKFRQSQARYHNRPYVIPNDIDTFLKNMTPKHFERMDTLTKLFNTAYRNVDPDKYFDCGFQLYKNFFSYNRFLNEKILNLYIIRDKNLKRDVHLSKKSIVNSLKFVVKWIGDKRNKNISLLVQYSSMYDDNITAPIKHYNMMKIDKYFLVWLIKEKYFIPSDLMKNDIPIITDNFRELSYDLLNIKDFLDDVKDKLEKM